MGMPVLKLKTSMGNIPLVPSPVTTVQITIDSWPTTDTLERYHGRTVDFPLMEDFWASQPINPGPGDGPTIIRTQGNPFSPPYVENVDFLLPGQHYIEFGNSGYFPDYGWFAQIFVDGVLIAEGDVGRNQHLIGSFVI